MKILLNQQELEQLTSRAPVKLECEKCFNPFYKAKNQVLSTLKGGVNKNGNRFCSKQCSSQSQKKEITIECFHCKLPLTIKLHHKLERNFCSRKCSGRYFGNLTRKEKPLSKYRKIKTLGEVTLVEKKPRIRAIYHNKSCSWCSTILSRPEREIRKSKTQTFFCNKSCKTKYLHKYQIVHKPRSRAEKHLSDLIRSNFPNLHIEENYRQLLSNNLEIDIYIPSLRLCIELNGPVHYFPIWGQDKLTKVQNKDIQKQIEIQKLGYNLIIIDISGLNSRQKTIKFLDDYFISHIKPLLE